MIKNQKAERFFISLFTLLLFVVFINRLFYGVETSDEAYYCVTGYRFMQGNIPLGDMWEPTSGTAYVMAPFLWIRSLFVQGGEGIQLYLRFCFLIPSFLGAWAVYTYAKKSIDKTYAFLLGLMLLFYTPFQLYTFSYNSLAYLFTSASVCFMLAGISKEDAKSSQVKSSQVKSSQVYLFLSGIAMALAVLSYPTMVYACILLAVAIVVFSCLGRRFKNLLLYACGGSVIALPIFITLVSKIGIHVLFDHLATILASDSSPGLSFGRIFSCITEAIAYYFTPLTNLGPFFSLYWLLLLGCSMVKRTRAASKYLVMFYPLICFAYAMRQDTRAVIYYAFLLSLIGLVSLPLSANRKQHLKKLSLEWGLSMTAYFVVSFSSGGGVGQAIAGLILPTIFGIKRAIEVLTTHPSIRLKKLGVYFLIFLVLGSEVLLFYHGIYRDAPYSELTARITSGAYKGQYTTPERKQHLHDLENVLAKIDEKDRSVMILYHSCYAYLMVDMLPKTPTSWGCVDYPAYGFDNQDLFMEYLSTDENVPEYIFMIDIPEEYDIAGQTSRRYAPYYPKLSQFIQDHYVHMGTYEEGSSGLVEKYRLISRESAND